MGMPTVVVSGWVEQPMVKPHGGRAQTRASNIKDAAAMRLESLVNGTAVGRGVENTDGLKSGTIGPVERLGELLGRVAGLQVRLAALPKSGTDDDARQSAKSAIVLRDLLGEARAEALSIWRDLPREMGSPEMAVAVVSILGGGASPATPKAGVPQGRAKPAATTTEPAARCPSCRRLLEPPKGVFGCCCGR
jgi:hypothetical protein